MHRRMRFIDEFKKFAFKGNAVDLAVGVVIGSAFSKIIAALVADLVMPIVALFMPRGNWRDNGLVLRAASQTQDSVVLRYGDFLGAVIDFFIIALILFIVVRKGMKAAEAKLSSPDAPSNKACPACCEPNALAARRCRACTSSLLST